MNFLVEWVPDDLPKMNPNNFRSINYNPDIAWNENPRPPENWIPVGWCKADETIHKPQPGIALMFDCEGELFWQHLAIYIPFGFEDIPPCFRADGSAPIHYRFLCWPLRCKACENCAYFDRHELENARAFGANR